MITIYKYKLKVDDVQYIDLPIGYRFLTIQTQNDMPVLWALVNTEYPTRPVKIITHGTGHEVQEPAELEHLATYQLSNGLVFHCFRACDF